MHKRISKILPVVLSVALTCTLAAPCTIRAAAKPQLSASKLELKVGETKKLSVKNNKKKVTWSSAKPSIATVNSKGTVKGISAGNTVVKAKVNKTSLKCAVTVKEKETIIRGSFKLYNGQNETTISHGTNTSITDVTVFMPKKKFFQKIKENTYFGVGIGAGYGIINKKADIYIGINAGIKF